MQDRRIGAARLLAATFATAGMAAWVSPARAACTVHDLSGIVADATIASAGTVAAAGGTPAYCAVVGSLKTTGEGAGPGAAGFELRLPTGWNGKVLVWGVGGLAGATYKDISANPIDIMAALPKGYATAITDEGHRGGGTDASFALLAKGRPNMPAQVDYAYRATHEVTVAAKELAGAYYGRPVERAYFDGCSNGGRQALVEATRYPQDFDGIIAGAPFLDLRGIVGAAGIFKALFATRDSYLPAGALPAIDAKVLAACDAADGVKDGLVQNPAACNVKPQELGLTPGQARFLATYIGTLRDERGRLIYPGHAITDLAGEGMDQWFLGTAPISPDGPQPWAGDGSKSAPQPAPHPAPLAFQFADHILQSYYALDPSYDYRAFPVTADGLFRSKAIAAYDARTALANASTASGFDRFIAQGRKLIWYHGLSDPALPPFRDLVLYEEMARHAGGYKALQKAIRLFAVPDMKHCAGGPGPNFFDTLAALEAWVERGQAPDSIVAAHYPGNKPAAGVAPDRTMPLCPFPTQASFHGGDVAHAASWSCAPNTRMLDVGLDGAIAGLAPPRELAKEGKPASGLRAFFPPPHSR